MAVKVSEYRDMGYKKFQLKVGGTNVNEDIARIRSVAALLNEDDTLVADANTGWTMHEAGK